MVAAVRSESGRAASARCTAIADSADIRSIIAHSRYTISGSRSFAGAPTSVPLGMQEVGLDHDLKERERELILATLRVTGGSRKLTAERLGISPRTLRHKLQQLKAAGHSVPRVHDQQFAVV